MKHLKGAHVPHKKNTGLSPVIMGTPKTVTIPTVMHIGAPAKVVVKAGDHVDIGTLIAEQNGFVSSPVFSSVSGTVTAIEDILLSNGNTVPAVKIETDGLSTIAETVKAPVVESKEDLLNAIKNSGIVGLGGAGFPTYVKFSVKESQKISNLIINGAECEPYITSDSVTMVQSADDIAYAIEILDKYFNFEKVVIGIEKNKPDAINNMKAIAAENEKITVDVLPTLYPQGAEKVLVYHTTGKQIGDGKLPIDVDCVVCNVTTIAAIGKYLKTGMPLVEKCVTVDGSVNEPQNVIVPIGTAIGEVFEFCGGFKEEPKKVIFGGPMMGITAPNLNAPVIKNTNAIVALAENDAKVPNPSACIRCGACANHCPFGINPTIIAKALKAGDIDTLKECGTTLCMECGCCSFVCPAKRPIVQNNRLAKQALRAAKEKEAQK